MSNDNVELYAQFISRQVVNEKSMGYQKPKLHPMGKPINTTDDLKPAKSQTGTNNHPVSGKKISTGVSKGNNTTTIHPAPKTIQTQVHTATPNSGSKKMGDDNSGSHKPEPTHSMGSTDRSKTISNTTNIKPKPVKKPLPLGIHYKEDVKFSDVELEAIELIVSEEKKEKKPVDPVAKAAAHHDEMMKFHDKMMDHHRLSAEGAEEEKNPNDKKFHDQEFKKHEKAFKAHEAAREAHIYGDAVADNLSKKADVLTKVKN